MDITRKDFLGSVAGTTALAAAQSAVAMAQAPPAAGQPAGGGPGGGGGRRQQPLAANSIYGTEPKKIRRGVSLFSYIGDFGSAMTLEDCFMEMNDMGAYGLEILSEAHVPDYPNPSNEWVDHWFRMMDKYRIKPAFYSSWTEDLNTPQQNMDHVLRDMRLAARLGFKRMRPKVAGARVRPEPGTRVGPGFGSKIDPKWEEWVLRLHDHAEKLDVSFAPEFNSPGFIGGQVYNDLLAFCEKYKPTHFGVQLDTAIFQTRGSRVRDGDFETEPDPNRGQGAAGRGARGAQAGPGGQAAPGGRGAAGGQVAPGGRGGGQSRTPDKIKDAVPILPYVTHFHGKFWEMLDDFTEYSIPFDEVIAGLKEAKWDGYFCSEYEGPRTQGLASLQLRRHHVMLKRLIGE